jgi:hypothetical protein
VSSPLTQPQPARPFARIVFWIVFLAAAGLAARLIWVKLDPLRNHPVIGRWWLEHNYAQLGSTHAPSAVRAWNELERCFLSKWAAYDWVVWRVKQNVWQKDDPLIHFRLERSGTRFNASVAPPATNCRTVTEALMAILHQEPGWKVGYDGDWRKWWEANWMAFPNRELQALPSGPEDPHPQRRR